MKFVKSAIIYLLFLLCWGSCQSNNTTPPKVGFYYWKTNYKLSSYEKSLLQDVDSRKIYLHFFDVDYDLSKQKIIPIAILNFAQPILDSVNYVPVVYITQNALNQLPDEGVAQLAQNIMKMMQQMLDSGHLKPNEIQFDCDWTAANQHKYFALLKCIKSNEIFANQNLKLSCTIRLHQIKFVAKVGVPPVDRGMLMCYNMGNLSHYNASNSILTEGEAKAYLKFLKTYPLPLDVTLPLFRWTAVFTNRQFEGVLYNFSYNDLHNKSIQKVADNRFLVLENVDIDGYSLKQGQELRVESPDFKSVSNLYTYIKSNIKDHNFTITFYHLDSLALGNYNAFLINKILNES